MSKKRSIFITTPEEDLIVVPQIVRLSPIDDIDYSFQIYLKGGDRVTLESCDMEAIKKDKKRIEKAIRNYWNV